MSNLDRLSKNIKSDKFGFGIKGFMIRKYANIHIRRQPFCLVIKMSRYVRIYGC